MNKREIGFMESELHSIPRRLCDMSEKQKEAAMIDMAEVMLAMNERLKTLESYVNDNVTRNL